MRAVSLVLFIGLLPSAAFAANGWRAEALDSAVMGEVSTLHFRIANTGDDARLSTVELQLVQNDYEVQSGDAPPGWLVTQVDKQDRRVFFKAIDPCVNGLPRGEAAVFGIRVVAIEERADALNDRFKKSAARGECGSVVYFPNLVSTTFGRLGLSAQMDASPRTLAVGETVTVALTLTNRTTSSQSGITPQPPVVASPSQFVLTGGPSPSALDLAPGASGTFVWTFRALENGVFSFSSSARNSTASSLRVFSPPGDVGLFPALTDVSPDNATGGQLGKVKLTVSNNSSGPYTEVRPHSLSFTGTAQATLASGPTPGSISHLSPGAVARFTWTYMVAGPVGSHYQFTGQAEARAAGGTRGSDPVNTAAGIIVLHGGETEPQALLDGSTDRVVRYVVANGGALPIGQVLLLAPDSTYFRVASPPFVDVPPGWTTAVSGGYRWAASKPAYQIPPGGLQSFTLRYARVGTGSMTRDMEFTHRLSLTQSNGTTSRVDAQVAVFVPRLVPDVASLVAVSAEAENRLVWSNPVGHDGVLVLRASGGAVSASPVAGVRYEVGQSLGNAVVAYSDAGSFVSNFADQGLSNGVRYHYRLFSHDPFFNYSSGNVPSSQGLFSEPTARQPGDVLWCYSLGYAAMQQPVTDPGGSVYSANMLGTVTANMTRKDEPNRDGAALWRPPRLDGAVQSRFLVVPLTGRVGKYLVVGDAVGNAFAVNVATGAVAWRGLGGAPLGDHIQAPPGLQAVGSSNSAFSTVHAGRDLVCFATRNASASTNRVYALSSVDGAKVWEFAPGTMDMVSGGMAVDYQRNRLFVASRSAGGTQPSLWVIDTVTGASVTPPVPLLLGDIDQGVTLSYRNGAFVQALVVNNVGRVHGIDLATLAVAWTFDLPGTPATFVTPANTGFIAVLSDGTIQRYNVAGSPAVVSPVWGTPPRVTGPPSGLTIDYVDQKLFVGGADGLLHQIRVDTGLDEKQVRVSTLPVGDPTVDRVSRRVHLGTLDGRVCAVGLPLP